MELHITYTNKDVQYYKDVEKITSPKMHNNGFFYIELEYEDSHATLIIKADIIQKMIVMDKTFAEVTEEDGVLQS